MEIVKRSGGKWRDEHRTRRRRARERYELRARTGIDLIADISSRSSAIGGLLDDLGQQPSPVSILGSKWSQSDLFSSPSVTIGTDADESIWPLPTDALLPQHQDQSKRFVLVAGGTKLGALMQYLDKEKLSLKTAGSHKGQSVAGAIATGTHGSFLAQSGLETHVRGMLLVGGLDHIHWIEDPGNPVLEPSFSALLGQREHDQFFHDALIHLGGLGYLNLVLLEVVERFGLSWAKACEPLGEDWWEQIANGKFREAVSDLAKGNEPSFYELTFDPSTGFDGDVMQTVYWNDGVGTDDLAEGFHAPDASPRDVLDLMMEVINSDEVAVDEDGLDDDKDLRLSLGLIDVPKSVFAAFRKEIAKGPSSKNSSSLFQLTGEWEPRKFGPFRIDTFNAAICVERERLRDAMELGFEVASGLGEHFVYTVRFAAKSPANIGFLRFENNAIINVDGLTKNFITGSSSDDAARDLCERLEGAGIPFSMHWGKDIPSPASKIAKDFGSHVTRWRSLRKSILSESVGKRLVSPMLRHWGLV